MAPPSLAPSTGDRALSTTFWFSTSIVFRVAFLTRLDLATAQMVCAGPSPGLTAAAIAVVVGQRGSGMRNLGFSGGSLSRLGRFNCKSIELAEEGRQIKRLFHESFD